MTNKSFDLSQLFSSEAIFRDVLWILPFVAYSSTLWNLLKLTFLLVGALLLTSIFRLPERFMPRGLILPCELIVAVLAASGVSMAAEAFLPDFTETNSYLVAIFVFAAALLPFSAEKKEGEHILQPILAALFRALCVLISFCVLGFVREFLAYGTFFDGTRFAHDLTKSWVMKPMAFFETVPGGFLLCAFGAALVSAIQLLLNGSGKKTKASKESGVTGNE